ncbi:MAG: fructosamine kinase family protein [Pseudomonadota bacterium]
MADSELVAAAEAAVQAICGTCWRITGHRTIAGGNINQALVIETAQQPLFVKYNRADLLDMFAAEHAALQSIAATQTIRVPTPIAVGSSSKHTFLVLEYLEIGTGAADWSALGEQLAALHNLPQPTYGWMRDNTIGSTPQRNEPRENWVDFWRDMRLYPQCEMAAARGAPNAMLKAIREVIMQIDSILGDHQPQPALLHGDLWAGNKGFLNDGTPVLFDPASYCGDRESDVAMSELFGGFDSDFYAAYRNCTPLESGYSARKALYNHYHLLNHFNLFGGAYAAQVEATSAAILRNIR